MQFEFATATRIIFGNGRLMEAGPLVAEMGTRALIVMGSTTLRAEPLFDILHRHQISYTTFAVLGEPTTDVVREGTQQARRERCDLAASSASVNPLLLRMSRMRLITGSLPSR